MKRLLSSVKRSSSTNRNKDRESGKNNWQDCRTWFGDITGLEEEEWKARRNESLDNPSGDGITLRVRNVETGSYFEAGAFRTMSLGSLQEEISFPRGTRQGPSPVFEVRLRDDHMSEPAVDVAHLQANAPDNSLFQVVSNFNATETPDKSRFPDGGGFVTNYALDSTKGSAASASAGVAAITRTHDPVL